MLEHLQEKTFFTSEDDAQEEQIVAAQRPVCPFDESSVTTALIAHTITDKYQYGMPLYRQESKFKGFPACQSKHEPANLPQQHGTVVYTLCWCGETSIAFDARCAKQRQLPASGRTNGCGHSRWAAGSAQYTFEYDPSYAGSVVVRQLDDFEDVLQADGFSGYSKVCNENNLIRIGCWYHARRKFIEADKSANPKAKAKKGSVSKASVALSYIRKLYRVESNIADKTD